MRQLGFLSNVPINDLVTCPDIDWLEIPLQSMNLVTESDTMLAPLKRTLVLKGRLVEGMQRKDSEFEIRNHEASFDFGILMTWLDNVDLLLSGRQSLDGKFI
ncbi:hypothetical protein D5086_027960 [Populus alba]|uniref:Uncharacterized protein n=1 Tax=Populus alba TaxID=43335 RepID=A0ACC4AXP0_POPAL